MISLFSKTPSIFSLLQISFFRESQKLHPSQLPVYSSKLNCGRAKAPRGIDLLTQFRVTTFTVINTIPGKAQLVQSAFGAESYIIESFNIFSQVTVVTQFRHEDQCCSYHFWN